MNSTFSFKVHEIVSDKDGNYLILDMIIQEYRITLVALYGPNNDSPGFFSIKFWVLFLIYKILQL